MHELSIAQSILETVREYVPEEDLRYVSQVKLRVGSLSGVVPESLDFSFRAITAETPLQKTRLEIQHVPFMVQCSVCHQTSSNDVGIVLCESCRSSNVYIISGLELDIAEIEVNKPVEEEI